MRGSFQNLLFLVLIFFVPPLLLGALEFNADHELSLKGKKVIVVETKEMTLGECLLLSSLQGLIAKKYPELYLSINANKDIWVKELIKYGAMVSYTQDWEGIYRQYSDRTKGCILVDTESISIGASLAGPNECVLITEDLISFALAANLPVFLDLRGKDEEWLFNQVMLDSSLYNLNAILQSTGKVKVALVDFAIANNYILINGINNPDLVEKFYALITPNSPRFGWGSPYSHEIEDVSLGSKNGLFTVPSGNTMNLSFLQKISVPLPREELIGTGLPLEEVSESDSFHYVTIMMSDGDNLNWYLNGMAESGKYYGSPLRGSFPVSWMIPPNLYGWAPLVANYYYSNRTINDYFIGSVSGQGYTYPSIHKNLDEFSRITGASLRASKLSYLTVMDIGDFNTVEPIILGEMIDEMPELKGIFYMDYSNYAKWGGKIFFSHNIPIVSFRYRLWLPMDSWQNIAGRLCGAKIDPASENGYSAIVVHAWSYSLAEVADFISGLSPEIKVVDPVTFFRLIEENVKH